MGPPAARGVARWVIRLRWLVLAAVVVLGYVAPWNALLGGRSGGATGPTSHLWGVLAVALGRTPLGISGGFEAVLAVGIAVAVAAALLRTVASARGGEWLAGGGTWLNVAALALLMPVSGAVFALVAVAVWEWVVVSAGAMRPAGQSGEEREPARTARGWASAVLREVYFWGVAASFAAAGWAYNAGLLVRCVLVSAGLGLVLRGVVGGEG